MATGKDNKRKLLDECFKLVPKPEPLCLVSTKNDNRFNAAALFDFAQGNQSIVGFGHAALQKRQFHHAFCKFFLEAMAEQAHTLTIAKKIAATQGRLRRWADKRGALGIIFRQALDNRAMATVWRIKTAAKEKYGFFFFQVRISP